MNSPINYREVLNGVEEEIKVLNFERAELEVNLGKLQNRLFEIGLKTEKLRPIADSLIDLIKAIPTTEIGHSKGAISQTQSETETNQISIEQINQDEFAKKQEPTETQKMKTQGGESLFDELFGPLASNTSKPENGIVEIKTSHQAREQTSHNDNNVTANSKTLQKQSASNEGQSASNAEVNNQTQNTVADLLPEASMKMTGLPADKNPTEITDNIRKLNPQEFDRADFYSYYPHLKNVQQTVPTLARTVLEYFGSGLKLSEITKIILALGHKHNSQNFTDSVHSTLKQKRATTGEFIFNATDRVWELAHWQNNQKMTSQPQSAGEGKSSEVKETDGKRDSSTNQGMAKKLTAEFSQMLQSKSSRPENNKSNSGNKQIRVIKKSGK